METALQRDLGRLEGKVESQGERLDALSAKLEACDARNVEKLDRIISFQERQKGGAKILLLVSSVIASAFGALAVRVIDWMHPNG